MCWERLSQQPHAQISLEPVDRDDQPGEVCERVGTNAARAPQLTEQLAVDDPELQAELLAHLVAPLQLQRGRTDHERRPRAVTQQQLLDDEPGLDRLAEADVIGDQQRRARHPQRADERLELEILDRDPTAKRRLQRPMICTRDRAPADGVEKRVQLGRVIQAARGDDRELGALADLGPRLDLPDDLKLLAGRVILDGDQRDEMLNRAAVERGLRVASDIRNDPHPAADVGDLAGLRRRGRGKSGSGGAHADAP